MEPKEGKGAPAGQSEIGDWLDKLGLGQYRRTFAENDIDFAVLPHLTDADQATLEKLADDMLREIALKGPVPLPTGASDEPDED